MRRPGGQGHAFQDANPDGNESGTEVDSARHHRGTGINRELGLGLQADEPQHTVAGRGENKIRGERRLDGQGHMEVGPQPPADETVVDDEIKCRPGEANHDLNLVQVGKGSEAIGFLLGRRVMEAPHDLGRRDETGGIDQGVDQLGDLVIGEVGRNRTRSKTGVDQQQARRGEQHVAEAGQIAPETGSQQLAKDRPIPPQWMERCQPGIDPLHPQPDKPDARQAGGQMGNILEPERSAAPRD